MGYTTAKVLHWNGERGICVDGYDTEYFFTLENLHPDDVGVMHEGATVVINTNGSIDLATGSFTRYRAMYE